MNNSSENAWISFLKLLRFVALYTIGIAAVFYLLPRLGIFIEGKYDALTSSVKFFSVIGFFAVIAVWHLTSLKDRLQGPVDGRL
jgi:hypothetical protein